MTTPREDAIAAGQPCTSHREQGFIYSVIGCPRCYPALGAEVETPREDAIAALHDYCPACPNGDRTQCREPLHDEIDRLAALAARPDSSTLDVERERITDALLAWAEEHNADPPLVIALGIIDADGKQALAAAERIRAALAAANFPPTSPQTSLSAMTDTIDRPHRDCSPPCAEHRRATSHYDALAAEADREAEELDRQGAHPDSPAMRAALPLAAEADRGTPDEDGAYRRGYRTGARWAVADWLASPEAAERLARALPNVPTVRALTSRLGRFNGAWWDRFASEVLAALREQGR